MTTGFVIEKHGFTSASTMMADVIECMIANGFTQKYPATPFTASGAGTSPYKVTMEASATVDPLSSTQPWRVYIEAVSGELVSIVVATPLQLPDDGSYAYEKNGASANTDIIGAVGGQATGGIITASSLTTGFINRSVRVGAGGGSYPLSYRLVISPRGFWLGTWEEAVTTESSSFYNWVLVQRPVDRDTGTVLTTGKSPVWCLNSTDGNYYQFVVREIDINRPGSRRPGDSNTTDSEAIINTQDQIRLTEDGKYIVNFPSRLNSSRYRYPHELDMIGATSSKVVSEDSDISLTVYGESSARTYKATQADSANNNGMRIVVLSTGGGIS